MWKKRLVTNRIETVRSQEAGSASLKKENEMKEMTKADYWEVQADMWHQNYKKAADEIERLREALKFYSDERNYEMKLKTHYLGDYEDSLIAEDNGKLARDILKETSNG